VITMHHRHIEGQTCIILWQHPRMQQHRTRKRSFFHRNLKVEDNNG